LTGLDGFCGSELHLHMHFQSECDRRRANHPNTNGHASCLRVGEVRFRYNIILWQ
jgi:hypothetical protein